MRSDERRPFAPSCSKGLGRCAPTAPIGPHGALDVLDECPANTAFDAWPPRIRTYGTWVIHTLLKECPAMAVIFESTDHEYAEATATSGRAVKSWPAFESIFRQVEESRVLAYCVRRAAQLWRACSEKDRSCAVELSTTPGTPERSNS